MLATLPAPHDPNLLVGMETSDDAGVYRLSDELALVVTADYITPPVDDPFQFGQIAAANALSDIYAMGGRPLVCLNLVGFPSADLDPSVLQRIIAGAVDKIEEAGATLAGGHSTEDDEPKFGLSVTGLVHPDKIWRNSGAQVGDRLILTKAIGSGVLINANRKGWVAPAIMEACIEQIMTLNKAAAEVLAEFSVHACTDVTGFGLTGHGFEMAKGAAVTLHFRMEAIPIMLGALEMYKRGMSTGVNKANQAMVRGNIRMEVELKPWHQEILYDPQTGGPLLAAVPAQQAPALVAKLREAGMPQAVEVGEVRAKEKEALVFA